MKTYTVGHFAYLDAFINGLLPCKVLCISKERVVVKLTANRGPFKRGEVLTGSHTDVIPRESVFVRNGKYRIRNNYKWEPRQL